MYEFYVTGNSKDAMGSTKTNFSPGLMSFNYAHENAGRQCIDAKPPTFMAAANIQFYSSNYPAIREAFISITKHWNDISSSVDNNNVSNYTAEAGKKKCLDLLAAIDNYYSLRKTMSIRTSSIQKSLFPFSVANSPDKKQLINMNDDLTAIQDLASLMSSYEAMLKNKSEIAAALSVIEDDVIKHSAEVPAGKTQIGAFNYTSYYSFVNDYISNTKELLNGTIRERDRAKAMDKNQYK